jgi:hypothetical protein
VAYAVVAVQWNYNDEWYYPGSEGGHVRVAYRSRERAAAECERLNAQARAQWRRDLNLPPPGQAGRQWESYHLFPFDMETRRFPGQDPFGPAAAPPQRSTAAVYGEEGEEEDSELESGEFAVEEVPFFEVIEFELAEGE